MVQGVVWSILRGTGGSWKYTQEYRGQLGVLYTGGSLEYFIDTWCRGEKGIQDVGGRNQGFWVQLGVYLWMQGVVGSIKGTGVSWDY